MTSLSTSAMPLGSVDWKLEKSPPLGIGIIDSIPSLTIGRTGAVTGFIDGFIEPNNSFSLCEREFCKDTKGDCCSSFFIFNNFLKESFKLNLVPILFIKDITPAPIPKLGIALPMSPASWDKVGGLAVKNIGSPSLSKSLGVKSLVPSPNAPPGVVWAPLP